MRIFCAIELPAEVRTRAAEHVARVRRAASDLPASIAKWEEIEKLHITLKFIGEIKPDRAEDVSRAAAHAAHAAPPFEVAIEGAGAFPVNRAPRVMWLGVTDASRGLAQLQQRLEDECAKENFAREVKMFHPHLTLARLRAPQGARTLVRLHAAAGFEAVSFTVTELAVMRSELTPTGSRYTVLSLLGLGPGRCSDEDGSPVY